MQIFNIQDKLSHVIKTDYSLLPVINRFGIRLGVKDKTIEQICNEKKLSVNFFLAIINTYHHPEYFPEKELQSFSPQLIIDYLKKTHRYYIEYILPKIEVLLEKLIESGKEQSEDLKIIKTFYLKYKKEWLLHIKEEEEEVFPYVKLLLENHENLPKSYSKKSIEAEHLSVDIKLNDLKNLIIKYLEPTYDDNICSEFLHLLAGFEKDSKDHARIEDKILLAQILDLEKRRG